MAKVSCGAYTILNPHPVLVIGTYDEHWKPNMMTASWGGICNSQPPSIAISLRQATQTYHNIREHKAFTVNIPSEKHLLSADYAGIHSGKDCEKFKDTKLTAVKSELVEAPYIQEYPYCLECKMMKETKLGLHTQFIGEILDVKADKDTLGRSGTPDIEKVRPLIYGGMGSPYYYGIGSKLGTAFTDGKKLKE